MVKQTPNHQLPYPESNNIADVPQDIKALADRLELILDAWYSPAEQDQRYQRVVKIATGLPPYGEEGDIVFLVTE